MKLYDLDIERGLLKSAISIDASIYDALSMIVERNDFYLPFHQDVFEAIGESLNKNGAVDEIFVKEILEKKKKYNEDLFFEILQASPIAAVETYAKKLKEYSAKRSLLSLSNEIKKELEEGQEDIFEVLDEIEGKIFNIRVSNATADFKLASEVVKHSLEYVKEKVLIRREFGDKRVIGLDTGFPTLNEKTNGFSEGDLIIIAARPSMGKTAFALNIALNVLNQDKGVAIFSLEMPAEQLMLRMFSAASKIPLQKLRGGNLTDEEIEQLQVIADNMFSKPLFIDDEGNINISLIKSKLRKLKAQQPSLSLIIIDYLQLINSNLRERHLAIADISRNLKLLARELKVPIIALSQLNRSLENRPNKRPMLSDLRESGAIEQDADIIMFIYRDDVYKAMEARQKQKEAMEKGKEAKVEYQEKDEEEAEIIIGKQRNGPTGVVHMIFDKRYTLFKDKAFEIKEIEPTEAEIGGIDDVKNVEGAII
jgi:replicative DNA helicase